MSEERFIEKLLRRYAQKRRADADTPLEMHPATRRLLQAEVARRYGKSAAEHGRESGVWARFWRGWARPLAWATPVLVAAGVIIWALQQPPQKSATPAAELSVAKSVAPQTAGVGEPSPETTASRWVREVQPESAPLPVARAPSPAAPHLIETPASPPPPSGAPTVAESFGALEAAPSAARQPDEVAAAQRARSAPDVALRRQTPPSSGAPAAPLQTASTAAPEQPALFLRVPPGGPTNVLSQAFINAAPAPTEPGRALDTARERRAPPADAASQVLTRFQLVQAGSQLQVVDADGSVYLADLADQTPVAASGETVAAAATEKAPVETARARRVGPSAARSTAPAAQAQAPPTRNVLRAVGTNRTLNQQVEFVWNFAPLTNGGLAARAQTASAPAAPVLQNVQLPLPPSVGIVGRARIGNTQEIEVRAVPQNSP